MTDVQVHKELRCISPHCTFDMRDHREAIQWSIDYLIGLTVDLDDDKIRHLSVSVHRVGPTQLPVSEDIDSGNYAFQVKGPRKGRGRASRENEQSVSEVEMSLVDALKFRDEAEPAELIEPPISEEEPK